MPKFEYDADSVLGVNMDDAGRRLLLGCLSN